MAEIQLRPVQDEDLDTFYDQMRDPEAVQMAAFTADDPDDRPAFDAHMARVLSRPDVTMRSIIVDGELAGHVAGFAVGDDTEVTYWLDRSWWGRGVATRALSLLLELVPVRPITARAASDNAGSLAVLRKVEETVLRLDPPKNARAVAAPGA
jgi:RimJ/RimL family protein N-acetyltransferase